MAETTKHLNNLLFWFDQLTHVQGYPTHIRVRYVYQFSLLPFRTPNPCVHHFGNIAEPISQGKQLKHNSCPQQHPYMTPTSTRHDPNVPMTLADSKTSVDSSETCINMQRFFRAPPSGRSFPLSQQSGALTRGFPAAVVVFESTTWGSHSWASSRGCCL